MKTSGIVQHLYAEKKYLSIDGQGYKLYNFCAPLLLYTC